MAQRRGTADAAPIPRPIPQSPLNCTGCAVRHVLLYAASVTDTTARSGAGAQPHLADDIARALAMRHVAAVGFSDKADRASHYVSIYLANAGYRVIGINALIVHKRDLPLSVVESLSDMPPPIEIVTVFRQSEELPEIAEAAIGRGARVLWLQKGITHPEAAARARAAGLIVIEDRCMLQEHADAERRRVQASDSE